MDEERFHGPRDYLDAARRPVATGEDLRALASSVYDFVRLAVAEHEAAPPDVLAERMPIVVLTWNDQDMLLRLARNNSTPTEALVRIGALIPPMLHVRDAQQAFAAGVALFQRVDAPQGTLETLLADPSTTTEFRKVVARETVRSDVLQLLRADRSERVRRAAERRS